MPKNLAVLLLAAATQLSLAQQAPTSPVVRFFFDTRGATEFAPRTEPLNFENPELDGSTGSCRRLYLYGEFLEPNETWIGIDLNICVTGPGEICSWQIYNAAGVSTRWTSIGNRGGASVSCILSIQMLSILRPGMYNTAGASQSDFNHFRTHDQDGGSAFGTTLLGSIDVHHLRTSIDPVDVYLEVGPLGIARIGGTNSDQVFFGFGDSSVKASHANARSTLPDASVLYHCEPCDTNCDGSVNQFDIQSFLQSLAGMGADCSPCAADTNQDGTVNTFDIQNLLHCLGM